MHADLTKAARVKRLNRAYFLMQSCVITYIINEWMNALIEPREDLKSSWRKSVKSSITVWSMQRPCFKFGVNSVFISIIALPVRRGEKNDRWFESDTAGFVRIYRIATCTMYSLLIMWLFLLIRTRLVIVGIQVEVEIARKISSRVQLEVAITR